MPARLTIRLLGNPEILLDERPLNGLGSRTAEALLIYLACHEAPLPRQKLADLLWDDRDPSQALANLRSILSSLRRELGDHLLSTRQTAGFDHASDYWLDTAEFERCLDQLAFPVESSHDLNEDSLNTLQAALELYRGDFLKSFFIRQGHGFEEWAAVERERLRWLVAVLESRIALADFRLGVHQRARRQLKAILPTAYELENGALISFCLQSLSLIAGQEGNYNQALRQAEKAIEAVSSYPEHYQFPNYRTLGNLAFTAGDLDQALMLAREKGEPAEITACLTTNGSLLVDLGGLALAHIGLALLKRKRREYEAAGAHSEAALAAGELYFALQAVVERAFFLDTGGFKKESLSLLYFAQDHPAVTAHDNCRVAELASTLERDLPQPLLAVCRSWAAGKSLEEAVALLP